MRSNGGGCGWATSSSCATPTTARHERRERPGPRVTVGRRPVDPGRHARSGISAISHHAPWRRWRGAGLVCAEDTRRTGRLLQHAGVRAARLAVVNEHTEGARVDEVIAVLGSGADVALVTDAGTPGISDPGSRLVAAVLAAGFEVTHGARAGRRDRRPHHQRVCPRRVSCSKGSCPARDVSVRSAWPRWRPSPARWCCTRRRIAWRAPLPTCSACWAASARSRWRGSSPSSTRRCCGVRSARSSWASRGASTSSSSPARPSARSNPTTTSCEPPWRRPRPSVRRPGTPPRRWRCRFGVARRRVYDVATATSSAAPNERVVSPPPDTVTTPPDDL